MANIKTASLVTITDLYDPIQQNTAPSAPVEGMLWLDTSVTPMKMKRWDGTAWVDVGVTPEYIASRGENLLTNGTGLLRSNYNFPGFTFNAAETYGAAGSFADTLSSTRYTTEYMPVNPDLSYRISCYAKQIKGNPTKALNRHYMFIQMLDVDKYNIDQFNVGFIAGTLTTLAQPLNNGDTKVYLASLTNWRESGDNTPVKRKLIFWDYQNSGGYQYPPESYSRNASIENLWAATGAFNLTEKSITLNAPWAGGSKPAGTQLSQNAPTNGSYPYYGLSYTEVPETWTQYTGVITGTTPQGAQGSFRPGTAYVRVGWLNHYGANQTAGTQDNNTILYSNVTFALDVATRGNTVASTDVEYYLSTSSSSPTGGSWVTTAPTWVNGKYMWSRTKTTKGDGTVTYSPGTNGTCIAGATGATGRGITSIVEQYAVSTSKTTEPSQASFSTNRPTWEPGKYVWTRSLITYTSGSPATSTTTPIVSSEWEAVNEIEIGGRNLLQLTNTTNWDNWGTGGVITFDTYLGLQTIKTVEDGDQYISLTQTDPARKARMVEGETYTLSLLARGTLAPSYNYIINTGITGNQSIGDFSFDSNFNSTTFVKGKLTFVANALTGASLGSYFMTRPTVVNVGDWFEITQVKLEKGNKATDWTAAPEDTQTQIDASLAVAKGKTTVLFYESIDDVTHPIDVGTIVFVASENETYRYDGLDPTPDNQAENPFYPHTWSNITETIIGNATQIASDAQNLAEAKAQIFFLPQATPPTSPQTGDIWIKTDDAQYRPYVYNNGEWLLFGKYDLDLIESQLETIVSTIIGGTKLFRQPDAPAASQATEGDLWFDSDDGGKAYRFQNGAWVLFDFKSILGNIEKWKEEFSKPAFIFDTVSGDSRLNTLIKDITIDSEQYKQEQESLNQLLTSIQANYSDISGKIGDSGSKTGLYQLIEDQKLESGLKQLLQDYKVFMQQTGDYLAIRRGIDGSFESPFELRISNERIEFVYNGTPIAYAAAQEFQMINARVTQKLSIEEETGYFQLSVEDGGLIGLWLEK